MGNTESTFGDRLSRGNTMHERIELFSPAFEPEDTSLQPAQFKSFLGLVGASNLAVATADAAASNDITAHKNLYELIKVRTLAVVDIVSGNQAWKPYLPKIREDARMVRNSRLRKKKTTPPPAGTPAKSKTGQQSYGDIDVWFEKLIESVKLIPGYKPAATSNIQIAQLTSLLAEYKAANGQADVTDAALSNARSARLAMYDADTGSLRAKMKAIKKATGGQYGRSSSQYAQVRGIRL